MLPESQGPSQQRHAPERPSAHERRLTLLWAAGVLLVVALRPLWLMVPDLLPRCRFRALTGLPCPTCGTSHAAVAMLQAHLGEALAANPLVTALALLVLLGGLAAPFWVLLARRRLPSPPDHVPRWALVAILALTLLNWAFLIATR
jgi:hypothetical protein